MSDEISPDLCTACEGAPKAPNDPCAVCGKSGPPTPDEADTEAVARVAEGAPARSAIIGFLIGILFWSLVATAWLYWM